MKVLALGGAGDMGRMAVAVLIESDIVTSITVADKDFELAKIFVELVGSDKLSAVEIDVTDRAKLVDIINSHDIVMSTVGPYYKFATMILEACIEAKKSYIDVCDDWKPTLDLLDMDQKAKDNGITALVGMGSSPGLLNLIAVVAASKLDEVDDLITQWSIGSAGGVLGQGRKPKYFVTTKKLKKKLGPTPKKPNAAIEHLLYETLEKIPTFKGGEMIEIESLTDAEPLQFPDFKDAYVVHIGHPEPVTLPRVIKANSISNLMHLGRTAIDILRNYTQKIMNKELTIQEATIAIEEEYDELTKKATSGNAPEVLKEYLEGPPPLCAIASGIKEGHKKKVAIGFLHYPSGGNEEEGMAAVTGIPLAIGTLMMLEGKIKQKGVITPGEAFKDHLMEFFDRYAVYCGKNLSGNDILLIKEVDL